MPAGVGTPAQKQWGPRDFFILRVKRAASEARSKPRDGRGARYANPPYMGLLPVKCLCQRDSDGHFYEATKISVTATKC